MSEKDWNYFFYYFNIFISIVPLKMNKKQKCAIAILICIFVLGGTALWKEYRTDLFVNLLKLKNEKAILHDAAWKRVKNPSKQWQKLIGDRKTFLKKEPGLVFPRELVRFENSVQHGDEQKIQIQLSPYVPLLDPLVVQQEGPTESEQENFSGSCSVEEIIVLDGEELVQFLETHTYSDCIKSLWNYSGEVASLFTDENMIAVANKMSDLAISYQGNNNENIMEFIQFLRLGYYHEVYHGTEVPMETDNIKSAVLNAFDNFKDNDHINDLNEETSNILSLWITTVDTSGNGDRYFDTLKAILTEFSSNQERKESYYQRSAIYYIFYLINRPQTNNLGSVMDQEMINVIHIIGKDEWLTDNETWLVNNAIWALGYTAKMVAWTTAVTEKLTDLMDFHVRYSEPWLWTVAAIDYFLDCQTSRPGETVCKDDIVPELENILFPNEYIFDDGAIVVKTSLDFATIERLYFAIRQVQSQFQRVSETITPIPNDPNSTLTMIIYGSKSDYNAYQSFLYDLSSNNGGIYIENWGTFFTYERTSSESSYTIEDLTRHEFVHYLQGRFLIEGDYNEGEIYDNNRIVWMTEGIAEFLTGSTVSEGVLPRKLLVDLVYGDGNNRLNVNEIVTATYNTSGVYEYSGLLFQYLYDNRIGTLRDIIKYVNASDIENYDALMHNMAEDEDLNEDFQTYLDNLIEKRNTLQNPYTVYPSINELKSSNIEEIETLFGSAWNGNFRGCTLAGIESIPMFSCRGTMTETLSDEEDYNKAWSSFDATLNKTILTAVPLLNNFESMNCRFGQIYYGSYRDQGIYPLVDFYCDGPLRLGDFSFDEPLNQVIKDFHSTNRGYIANCSTIDDENILCEASIGTTSKATSTNDEIFSNELDQGLKQLQNEVYAISPNYYRNFSCEFTDDIDFVIDAANATKKYALRPVSCLTVIPKKNVCSNTCSANSSLCFGNENIHCGNFDPDSCLEWSIRTECADSTSCDNGQCVAQAKVCEDECQEEGTTQCSGKGYATCERYDSDTCLEWSVEYECSQGTSCEDGVCVPQVEYSLGFGDSAFFEPHLYDETFEVPITCNSVKDGVSYNCGDFGSKITSAYASIKDSTGIILQKFDLLLNDESGSLYKGSFDYDSLTDESYTLGVYAEDNNGLKADIPDYSLFSGQGWNLCSANTDCIQYHSCINNMCMLDSVNYKLGLVYIYNNTDTYNPDWRSEFSEINQKVINGIEEETQGKIRPTLDILGEVQTDIFCWNPAIIGGKLRNIEIGNESYFQMPGSQFSSTGQGVTGYEIVETYCDNCILEDDIYQIDCENDLSYSNLWTSDKQARLNQQISEELNFNFDDYDGVFVIFGKLGHILPQEDSKNLEYRCITYEAIIGGYSNLIMAENSIKSGGLIQCDTSDVMTTPYYDSMGWKKMVHEVLHRFGAVDVYDTGSVFGYDPSFYRNRARLIDPRTDESVMGNEEMECIEEGGYEKDGNICTQQQLDAIYLDKYNQQKIGIISED